MKKILFSVMTVFFIANGAHAAVCDCKHLTNMNIDAAEACYQTKKVNGNCVIARCKDGLGDAPKHSSGKAAYFRKSSGLCFYDGNCIKGRNSVTAKSDEMLQYWVENGIGYTDGKCIKKCDEQTQQYDEINGKCVKKGEGSGETQTEAHVFSKEYEELVLPDLSLTIDKNCKNLSAGETDVFNILVDKSVITDYESDYNRHKDILEGNCNNAEGKLNVNESYREDGKDYVAFTCTCQPAQPAVVKQDDARNQSGEKGADKKNTEDASKNVEQAIAGLNAIIGKDNLPKANKWRDADGNFNTARLASDVTAGVVLGTAGALITSHLVKKHQVSEGFEDIQCTISGQTVAGFGDEFTVGVK